jgi:hypothetical protein
VAAAFGVVRFPGPGPGFGIALLKLAVTTIIFGVVFLGEETGWRGYLLFRLAELTSGRRAALLTGAFHAIRHLPLLLLTTTYQNAGNLWIVVPTVMVTLLGRCLVRLASTVVGKHLAGQPLPQCLQQRDQGRRRRGNSNLAGNNGLRDHRGRPSWTSPGGPYAGAVLRSLRRRWRREHHDHPDLS